MNLAEGAKLQICCLLHRLWDLQLRHRVESIVAFSHDYIGDIQSDQLRRYVEIKQSDLPSAIAAKKTREFRCPPREQMNAILGFKNLEEEEKENCPINDELRQFLLDFHTDFAGNLSVVVGDEETGAEESVKEEVKVGLFNRMMTAIPLVKKNEEEQEGKQLAQSPEKVFRKVIISTIVHWAQESVST